MLVVYGLWICILMMSVGFVEVNINLLIQGKVIYFFRTSNFILINNDGENSGKYIKIKYIIQSVEIIIVKS